MNLNDAAHDVQQDNAHPDEPEPWPLGGELDEIVAPGITRGNALMLSRHAIYVQGGHSDPHREAERGGHDFLRAQAHGPEAVANFQASLVRMSEEVDGELRSRLAAEPTVDAPADNGGGFPLDLVRRYKRLRDLEKGADAEAKAFKDEANALEGQIIDAFVDNEMQSTNLEGKTVYLQRTTFAQRKPGFDAEDVKKALIDAGEADLVTTTVNASTLSAYVRELVDGEEPKGLPEPVAAVLELGERYNVRIKASAGGRKR